MRENTPTLGVRASSNPEQPKNAVHENVLLALARLLARQAVADLAATSSAPAIPTSSNVDSEENCNADQK
jgi:hypothetical protein